MIEKKINETQNGKFTKRTAKDNDIKYTTLLIGLFIILSTSISKRIL